MKRITKIDASTVGEKRKLRVAAYARVSTDSKEQMVSLAAQKNHYERYIQSHPNWEYAGLYYDEGVSGTKKDNRSGLLQLLTDCERGLIDYVIIKSISRFSRNTVECVEMVRQLCEKGIYIYFEKENIDTGKMEGELLLSILSSLAESESHSISENNRWSIQRRFLNGTYKIGYPPYGYDNVEGMMVINGEQAKIVQRIFDEILSGKSAGAVARSLNLEQIPSKRGGSWTGHTICGMIRNEKYTGDVIFQKSYSDDRFRRHTNKGEKNMYYMKDHHEPIVSREIFDAANAMINQNGLEKGHEISAGKYNNRYPMSGKIRCGKCGGSWKRVKLSRYHALACQTHIQNHAACPLKAVPEESVKAAFATMMNKLTFCRSVILLPFAQRTTERKGTELLERLSKLEALLEDSMERQQQIHQFFTSGLLDPAVYAKEEAALAEDIKRMKDEKKSLESHMSGGYEQQEALDRLLKYTAKGITLTAFDGDLFTEHVDHIVIYDQTEIGFAMKFGPIFRERI